MLLETVTLSWALALNVLEFEFTNLISFSISPGAKGLVAAALSFLSPTLVSMTMDCLWGNFYRWVKPEIWFR